MTYKYCNGCGLCFNCSVAKPVTESGQIEYVADDPNNFEDFIEKVCPSRGHQFIHYDRKKIWGRNLGVFLGYSTDDFVRNKASSGGIITSLCIYLIDNHLVDGILHVIEDPEDPISTRMVIHTTKDELINSCGSRYSESHPLSAIDHILVGDSTYAFVGRPCDVAALRNYSEINDLVGKHVLYYFSFFCAGTPNRSANERLVSELGCDISRLKTITYRGNGWPGFVTAVDENGDTHMMPYENAWGKILGRDIKPICRLCSDGIGEMADVACGDAWYLKDNGTPDFTEHEGRNVVFARTSLGKQLLSRAKSAGYLSLNEYKNYEAELSKIQTYQLERRQSLSTLLLVYRMFGLEIPEYDKRIIAAYSRQYAVRKRIRRAFGVAKRIHQGKIK